MKKQHRIPASDEAWESGELGDDPKFAKVFEGDVQARIDGAMAMQPISIRLPKSLIETFKLLGEVHGLGYQPLMRRALVRFAEGEMKLVLNEVVAERRRAAESAGAEEGGGERPEASVG